MLTARIIPCLDVDEGRVVKGVGFKNLRPAGDPESLAALYDEQGADEIVFLDIGATWKSRRTLLRTVEAVSRRVFVPLTVGGGITSVGNIRDALNAGADKAAVCSAALRNPDLLGEAAAVFGSQCVVLSIDAARSGETWTAFSHGGRVDTGRDALLWARQAERAGAGEILLNSIDRDGTQEGFDLDLVRRTSEAVSIPVIASGGAGSPEHLRTALVEGGASAVLLASLLHDGVLTVPEIKTYLLAKGVPVR
ncbi:MAG: imidazole glycerol phosphate synthase subunit HisF [Acidobacteriota bacterium]|nr:imidazole glycerol phosphate synthase subunit HisF [Acidobacteriota bacterium]